MTDHPRFQTIDGPDEHCYRRYHGATVVDLVLGLVDWWLKHRNGALSIRFRSLNVTDRAQQNARTVETRLIATRRLP